MESASQAIIGIDHKGLIQVVNNKAEELFGYTRDELIGQRWKMLLPEAHFGKRMWTPQGIFRAAPRAAHGHRCGSGR